MTEGSAVFHRQVRKRARRKPDDTGGHVNNKKVQYMTIDKVMNNLYDALSKNQDTIWFDYQGFRWELGYDLSFHPRHILYPGNCSEDRRVAQYSCPIPYYSESGNEYICESLL